ncbi:preprotein translocase subunit SecE [Schleiferilactobacillus harbinensis]|uniref:Protein translocase subunit SecE n=1 Tax=Schleiferilactobacillus harbinensis TaxID=304207 RepID=A0ABU7T0P2_9LACO
MKFLKSVVQEMKLVTWPTFKENRHDTGTVMITSILFGVFFGAVDWVLGTAMNWFVKL